MIATINIRAILTNYDLCASFIANNSSDSHVINQFYRDRLTNIQLAYDINVQYRPNIIKVELINNAYYNIYN